MSMMGAIIDSSTHCYFVWKKNEKNLSEQECLLDIYHVGGLVQCFRGFILSKCLRRLSNKMVFMDSVS